MSLTLNNLRSRVTARLGLDATSSGSEATLVDGYLNDAYEDFLVRSGCWITRSTMTTTSGSADYDLDQDIAQLVELSILDSDGDTSLPARVSARDILELRRSSSDQDSPSRRFAVQGHNLLMLWPTPTGSDTITIYYVPRPTTLSASSDTPSLIPPQYHRALEFYALAEMADYDDDQSSGMGQSYLARYEQMVVRARREGQRMGSRRMAPARVGKRVERQWPIGRDDGS